MRYRGKGAFRLLQVSRAGLFCDLSAGDTYPLRIPVTQLLINDATREPECLVKDYACFVETFVTGCGFPHR